MNINSYSLTAGLSCPHTGHILQSIVRRAFPEFTGRSVDLRFTDGLPTCYTTQPRTGQRTVSRAYSLSYGTIRREVSFAAERAAECDVLVSSTSEDEAIVSHTTRSKGRDSVTIHVRSPISIDDFFVLVDARMNDPLENGTPRRFGTWLTTTLVDLTPGETWGHIAQPVGAEDAASGVRRYDKITRRCLVWCAVEARVAELAHKQAKLDRDFAKSEAELAALQRAQTMDFGRVLKLPGVRRLQTISRGRHAQFGTEYRCRTIDQKLEALGLVREVRHRDGKGSRSYEVTRAGAALLCRIPGHSTEAR